VFQGGLPVAESQCFGTSEQDPVTVFPKPSNPVRHLGGTYLFGGILSGHFGHMLTEGTGRLWALEGRGDVAGVLFFARPFDKVRRCARQFSHLEQLLGLPPVTVLEQPVTVDALIVAAQGLGSETLLRGRPELRSFLRGRLAAIAPAGNARRLYISRSGLPARRGMILGEAGLESLFAAAGYEIVRPETLSLPQQVALYRAASHVVGTEGSPFHLLAMAGQPHCKVGVIQRRRSPSFARICDHLEEFLGGRVLRADSIASIHAPESSKQSNLVYLEPSRPALWQGLNAAGFLDGAPASSPWENMATNERLAAVAWLTTGIGQELFPR
jgi:hypothetical protein